MFANGGNEQQFQGPFGHEFRTYLSLRHTVRYCPLSPQLSKDVQKTNTETKQIENGSRYLRMDQIKVVEDSL